MSAPAALALPVMATSDASLVGTLRVGDPRAAEVLYTRYARRIHTLVASRLRGPMAARLCPDDVVQSVFRTFFQGVVERAYTAPEGRELWSLLCVLALNKVRERVSYHQAARRDVRRTGGSVDTVADDDAEARWLAIEVDDMLDSFRRDDREVIKLRLTGYEVSEIALMAGRSLRTVERVLQKARTRLTEILA